MKMRFGYMEQIARCQAASALLLGLLAAIAVPAAGQAPQAYRSLSDVRQRIPDEHDRPYFRETQTHRGWEIREPQFTIFAATSAADARWAAGQVATAWGQASRLADRWTERHHNPDFGLSALQVAINSEPLGSRYLPATTITAVGIQTQVTLNVGQEQPSLPQQVVRLREAAAFAMLHTAGLDTAAPAWVVKGLAAAAGRSGLTKEEIDAAVDPRANMGGEQWQFRRSDAATLAYPPLDQQEAASRIEFLLQGDDGQHAPALFGALRQAMGHAVQGAANGKAFQSLPGDLSAMDANPACDQLIGRLMTEYAAWKQNPQAGQPVFETDPDASAHVAAAERDMVVLLKLHRRLSGSSALSDAATQIGRSPTQMKIITFDQEKGTAVRQQARRASAPLSFAAFAARLADSSSAVWATLDVDGSLLLSTDAARWQSLLAAGPVGYEFVHDANRTVLVRRLEDGTRIEGWLEENAKDKSRPLARFELSQVAARPKIIAPPRAGSQVFDRR